MADEQDGRVWAEKLATQAETGAGRTMARPASIMPGGPNEATSSGTGGSGLAGAETNDAMPGGGATGNTVMPDTVAPETSP